MALTTTLSAPAPLAITSENLAHWCLFARTFAFLSPEMQAGLWETIALSDIPELPFVETEQKHWAATYDAWALSERYPGAVSAGPAVGAMMARGVDGEGAEEMNAALMDMRDDGTMVVEDALDWVPWVYGMAKWQVAGGQPGKVVLDAQRWGEEITGEAVARVKDLPAVDRDGVDLWRKVEVLVGSLARRDAAARVARLEGVSGKVEIVLMWDVKVWKFLEEAGKEIV